MKALALALALAATPAHAIEWTPLTSANHGTERYYIDADITHTREAATTAFRIDDLRLGRSFKYLVYVSAEECNRGFGSLHASDLGGGPITKMRGGFTLGEPVTVADHVAARMCAVFDY